MQSSLEKFQSLLRELFQFDHADLDFGIYRILNYKRNEIEYFINSRLPEMIQESFLGHMEANKAALVDELDRKKLDIIENLGEDAFDERGNLTRYTSTKLGKQYLKAKDKLAEFKVADEFRNRIFNDLYKFFSRYYEDGDFTSKRRYGRDAAYAIPYNGEEVSLYWANKDQYYIKTAEQFKFYRFDIGSIAITFELRNVSIAENLEGHKRYFVLADNTPIIWEYLTQTLRVFFEYRPLTEQEENKYGKTEQQKLQEKLNKSAAQVVLEKLADPSSKHLREVKTHIDQTELVTNLNQFASRNTTDFFIHKDLHRFLLRELDFFIKSEVVLLDELLAGAEANLARAVQRGQVVREIGEKIVDFFAQIEDFQRDLFEKKKFVVCTDYCITIDRVPTELWGEVIANEDQINEWEELYALDTLLETEGLFNKELSKEFLDINSTLVVDTKFFSEDFKWSLLSHFDDLDAALDGILIKSENFQALNLLSQKYEGAIKCVYIDPPYNTGNDEFLFKDNYQHSCWMAMMSDRLAKARDLMREDGLVFVTIDDNELAQLRSLMDEIFGEQNFIASIAWLKKYTRSNNANLFSDVKDFILLSRKSPALSILREPRTEESNASYSNPDNDPRGDWIHVLYVNPALKEARPNLVYPIKNPFTGEEVTHPTNAWKFSRKENQRHIAENRLYWGEDGTFKYPRLKIFLSESEGLVPKDVWELNGTAWRQEEAGTTDEATGIIKKLFGANVFQNPKPPKLIEKMITTIHNKRHEESFYVLDFFAGSGSTAHAVINANRQNNSKHKYILIEMGDWFEDVLLPRIKKIAFAEKWKDGKPQRGNGMSHFFKYHTLEQYDDTLNNLVLTSDPQAQSTLEMFGDEYLLQYFLKFETQDSACLFNSDVITNPFNHRLRIRQRNEITAREVDLLETFNYLLGIAVKKMQEFRDGDYLYRTVLGERHGKLIVAIWRETGEIQDDEDALLRDKQFIEKSILPELLADNGSPDRLFVNGPCFVKNAEATELEFSKRMFARGA